MNVWFRWLNVIALIAMLAVNWLANALPLGGLTTGELSAKYPVPITPAPYAFSIWGLIYALLLLFAIVQVWPGVRDKPEVRGTNPWFLISCVLNSSWIVVWHYQYISASVFVMLALLITLIGLYMNTRTAGWSNNRIVRWLVQAPFSVYLGWISVATIVNVTVAVNAVQWNGMGLAKSFWTYAQIGGAMLLALIISRSYRDPFFSLVVAWALAAIGVANESRPTIAYTAWGGAAVLVLFAIWLLASRSKPDQPGHRTPAN